MNWEMVTVGPFAMNCYILFCEKTRRGLVVDPGDEVERIIARLQALHVQAEQVVITHGHVDHILKLKDFQERTGLPVAMHPLDRDLVNYLPETAQMFGLVPAVIPVIDRDLADGETIAFGEVSLTVVHTPGHSPGSVSLIGQGHAVVGDVLFRESIGRTDLPGGSYSQLINTIREKLLVLDDATVVLSGHGPTTTIGHERRNNPFLLETR